MFRPRPPPEPAVRYPSLTEPGWAGRPDCLYQFLRWVSLQALASVRMKSAPDFSLTRRSTTIPPARQVKSEDAMAEFDYTGWVARAKRSCQASAFFVHRGAIGTRDGSRNRS